MTDGSERVVYAGFRDSGKGGFKKGSFNAEAGGCVDLFPAVQRGLTSVLFHTCFRAAVVFTSSSSSACRRAGDFSMPPSSNPSAASGSENWPGSTNTPSAFSICRRCGDHGLVRHQTRFALPFERHPVDRVLQQGWNRTVVFRAGDQQGVVFFEQRLQYAICK